MATPFDQPLPSGMSTDAQGVTIAIANLALSVDHLAAICSQIDADLRLLTTTMADSTLFEWNSHVGIDPEALTSVAASIKAVSSAAESVNPLITQ